MTTTPGVRLDTDPLEVMGRIMPASNQTFLCRLGAEEDEVRAVYKPTAGERPLWDFPDGTLALRERAAYLVSEAIGWSVVPPTVLRDGPLGPGMVQLWVDPDAMTDAVDIVPQGEVPGGYLPVLDAHDAADRPVTLVHEDTPALRRMAVFDAVVNNTDRKGGHVLSLADGRRLGVDHGVCFHVDDKLRTVLWGWAGEPLSEEELAGLDRLATALSGELGDQLAELLAPEEVDATRARLERLRRTAVFPHSVSDWHTIPWPPF